jgi:hypothetical protein
MTDCTERHLPQLAFGLDGEGQKGIAKESSARTMTNLTRGEEL